LWGLFPSHLLAAASRPKEMWRLLFAIQLLTIAFYTPIPTQSNPHRPQNLTWVVLDTYVDILNSTSSMAVPGSWFPDLYFDFAKMMHSTVSHKWIKRCGGGGDVYFCESWDCVSTGHISWDPPLKGDFITLSKAAENLRCSKKERGKDISQNCNPVKVSFTAQGKKYRGWQGRATWGGRIYDNSGDEGNIFTIKLIQTPAETPVPIGPNNILTNRREPTPQPTCIPEKNLATPDGHSSFSPQSHPGYPLWEIAKATYHLMNSTNPNLTTACWFCYNIQPPYYEAVGLVSSYHTSSSDKACRWKHGSQTLQSISGKGTCIGKVPTQYKQYCNTTHSTINTSLFYIPPKDGWWACSTGLTACDHSHVIHTNGFCILVQVMPCIYFHIEEDIYNTYSGSELIRCKREPISTLTVALLVGLGLTGTGTGIASLAHQYSQYNNLRAAIEEDLERIETSISHLQKSLTSLSEVVLQNRRGLDLLFLQEGGLCVALREECCFYADHSGIVQESMTKLREGLNIWKREREGQQGWFESWYNVSPWLTTLLSALAGPLILLILIGTFGPCLLNRLSTFIRGKLENYWPNPVRKAGRKHSSVAYRNCLSVNPYYILGRTRLPVSGTFFPPLLVLCLCGVTIQSYNATEKNDL
uniref:Envelope protein n=1 Tax=Naja naja TaxID=35670 RepID=A0A8C6X374_NAJNA